jgi:hypothetical protein
MFGSYCAFIFLEIQCNKVTYINFFEFVCALQEETLDLHENWICFYKQNVLYANAFTYMQTFFPE